MNNPYRGKRVAIYARASTKRQANVTQSIKGQIDSCHAWVSQKAAPADIVLVEARSRLCRDAAQFIEVKTELHRCGVQIVSTSQTGGDEPTSNLSSDLLAVFDAHYSADS